MNPTSDTRIGVRGKRFPFNINVLPVVTFGAESAAMLLNLNSPSESSKSKIQGFGQVWVHAHTSPNSHSFCVCVCVCSLGSTIPVEFLLMHDM